jgi:adenylate kinase
LRNRGEAIQAAVMISLEDDEVVRRISGRRSCGSCGALSHVVFSPPRKEGVCDSCETPLRQREDDREEVVRKRLAVYREQTAPLEARYAVAGLLRKVDGSGSMADVQGRIMEALGSR